MKRQNDELHKEFLKLQQELGMNQDMSQSCVHDLMKQLQDLRQQVYYQLINIIIETNSISTTIILSLCKYCGTNQNDQNSLTNHQFECDLAFIQTPCNYCKELIIPIFIDEHYSECIAKINHDFENMMQQETGMVISIKKKPNKQECCICCLPIEQFQSKRFLECAHVFHSQCIEQWIQKSKDCPYCRVVIK